METQIFILSNCTPMPKLFAATCLACNVYLNSSSVLRFDQKRTTTKNRTYFWHSLEQKWILASQQQHILQFELLLGKNGK